MVQACPANQRPEAATLEVIGSLVVILHGVGCIVVKPFAVFVGAVVVDDLLPLLGAHEVDEL